MTKSKPGESTTSNRRGADTGRNRRLPLWPLFAVAGCSLALSAAKAAQRPCTASIYQAFDFWLGDWQVLKAETGALAGIDRIEKILGGCAIRQTWLQLDDSFRPEGVDSRLIGESLLTVTSDGQWRQIWVDNSGYTNTLTGGPDENGVIVLRSGPVLYPGAEDAFVEVFFEWRWSRLPDGHVRSWGKTRITADGAWETSFDNIYRPNR